MNIKLNVQSQKIIWGLKLSERLRLGERFYEKFEKKGSTSNKLLYK